ncbi:Hpt protein [Bradyrhizobium sp. STM 3843]|nr:Hpt protein [Bradyrhizobium sp. STM 3843]
MTPDLHRIEWMPSPPLVPDDGPISLDQLRRMTLGDRDLEREVLDMFATQADRILTQLMAMPDDASALAHTLKGSARAIGALAVAEAAEALESAIRGSEPSHALAFALAELDAAVGEARMAIAEMLAAF